MAEAVGGLLSGSMALISDATHNFSDVLSLIISYIANRLAKQKATAGRTYGLKRSEIVAAFINSATLMALAVFILIEGIRRLLHPEAIAADWVIWLAVASILVNGLSVLFVHRDAQHNINIKSAYLHLFSDLLTSVAVLIGGLAMKFYHWYSIDAIFSIFIAFYLIYSSWGIFKTALCIIMQFTPTHIEMDKIANVVMQIAGVKNIHHVHIWQIDEHQVMLEAHVDLDDDIKVSDFSAILTRIKHDLLRYKINHVTIQPEFESGHKDQVVY